MSASTEKKNRRAELEAGTNKKQVAQQKRDEKKAKEDRTMTICIAVVAVIVVAAILLNVIPGIKNSREMKKYADGVALTVGSRSYSPAELGYVYFNQYSSYINNNYYYALFFGLDTSSGPIGLGSQPYYGYAVEGQEINTWRDYFMYASSTQLEQVQALLKYAAENGITLTDEEKSTVEANVSSFKTYATQYGYASTDQFLSANISAGLTMDAVLSLELDNALAQKALNAYGDSLSFTDEELDEEFASFDGDYDGFSYAYYTVTANEAEDEEGKQNALIEARAEADAVIMSYQDGYDVDDLYERLNGYIEEELGGSAVLSEDVTGAYLDALYSEWLKDAARQPGDITRIDGDSGSTALLFLGRESADYPTVNIRHILIKAEASEDGTWSDEALAAAQAKAEEILAEYLAGEQTEERFAALAEQYSEDGGSNTNGGLYENVYKGEMVQEFNDFCFAGHQKGDTGIVYGSSSSYAGYHVMYFAGEDESYADLLAKDSLTEKAIEAFYEDSGFKAVFGADAALVDPVAETAATEAAVTETAAAQ